MRVLIGLILTLSLAGEAQSQQGIWPPFGPFADSLEYDASWYNGIQIQSQWPVASNRLGTLRRLTRLRHSPSFSPSTVLTISEHALGTRLQMSYVDGQGWEVGQEALSISGLVAGTYAVDSLLASVAVGLDAARESARQVRPNDVIGFDGETFSVTTWNVEEGVWTWSQWSPGHESPHDHVADLIQGIIVSAFLEGEVTERSSAGRLPDYLRAMSDGLYREAFGEEPDSLDSGLQRRLVARLAERALAAGESFNWTDAPARPIDSLFISALHQTRGAAEVDTVRKYLAMGADPRAIVQFEWELPSSPLSSVSSVEAARLLVEAGATFEGIPFQLHSPLASAALTHDLERVRFLLANGADPNGRDSDGRPAILRAYEGAPHNARPIDGDWTRTEQVLMALLDAGADPNAVDGNGWSILHYIHYYRSLNDKEFPPFLADLVARGANPELRDFSGYTPAELEVESRRARKEWEAADR